MERVIEHTDVPLELITGIEGHRAGLRMVDLFQMQGRSSYVRIKGARWQLSNEVGEPPGPDEEPSEETSEIAGIIYAEAELARNAGGHPHFKALLRQASKDGTSSAKEVKFTVAESSVDGREETARAGTIDAMAQYIKDLQAANVRATNTNSRTLEYVGRVLPKLIEMRMDAIEDRAEAMLEGLGVSKKKQQPEEHPWKPAADTVKEAINVFGPPAAMKAFDLTAEQANALFNKPTTAEVKTPAANATLRELLVTFGESLTVQQKLTLFAALDSATIEKLKSAAKASDEQTAAQLCAEVLDVMSADEKKAEAIEAMLVEAQRGLLKRIISTVETIQGK